ncbi:MAG: Single-stranded DNA-binding protein ssb [Tenericutes bacterium ADurb.BinA124]|nr:MAG: Single-stranded DNA-binding protein ssb [Tenericutes bacterium ADurb.BinA124]
MNLVIIIGRIVKDPELVFINEFRKCDFTVAINSYSSKTDKKVDFIDCTVWGKQAENFAKYMRKGSQVAVKGALSTNIYETKNGVKVKQVKVSVDQIEYIDSPSNRTKDHEHYEQPEAPEQQPTTPYSFMPSNDELPF